MSKSLFLSCSLEDFVDVHTGLIGDEKRDFVEFISSMLKLAPEERFDAKNSLETKWMRESLV